MPVRNGDLAAQRKGDTVYRYLFVLPGQSNLAMEEVSGLLHHRALQLFTLLARHFDRIVLEPFQGAVRPAGLANQDLICLVPSDPWSSLVVHLVLGFVEAGLQHLSPDTRLSLPKGGIQVEASKRSPDTQPGRLLALIRTDPAQVEWVPGTSRRRGQPQFQAVWLLGAEQVFSPRRTGTIAKSGSSARAEED
jgi:hypothetical protein